MVLFATVPITVTIYLESVEKKSIRLAPISELGAISDIGISVSIDGDEVAVRLPARQPAKQNPLPRSSLRSAVAIRLTSLADHLDLSSFAMCGLKQSCRADPAALERMIGEK